LAYYQLGFLPNLRVAIAYNYYKIMVFIRNHSIQDILRNINRRLTLYDIVALPMLLLVLVGLFFVTQDKERKRYQELRYIENNNETIVDGDTSSHIFASKSGKTYTYTWCQGSGRIKESNKIYFTNEAEAKSTGRTLSKLCK
jgi:hypothetical protein